VCLFEKQNAPYESTTLSGFSLVREEGLLPQLLHQYSELITH
jgi:hypothetical protein